MATPGLSLVGFMEQPQALAHLRFGCKPANESVPDAQLIQEWNAARAKLGVPYPSAGKPKIQKLPAVHNGYEQAFFKEKWIAAALQQFPGIQIRLVEIEPLLAYQFSIDKPRSQHHCGNLASPPSLQQLLAICLPTTLPPTNFRLSPIDANSKSLIITTPNHNLQSMRHGVFDVVMGDVPTKIGGVLFNETLPFVHVVRFNGQCFLHNGYHRVLGISAAGAKEVPCLFRDVNSFEEAGVKSDGTTFAPQIFQAGNPPTVAHFTQGRAYDVRLRKFSRMIHVSWSQYTMPDE